MFVRRLSTAAFTASRRFSATPSVASGRLQGKSAIVTGGAAGIGREACVIFAREGADVLIADLDLAAAQETQRYIEDLYPGVKTASISCDVSQAEHVQQMVGSAETQFGKLDVIFNNAGVMLADDDTAENTEEHVFDRTFNINVKGVIYGCKYALPALRRAGGGSIINTASFVAKLGSATPQIAYTASKGAVLALTRELAVLHARENIRVNALCPGPVRTDLLMNVLDTPAKKQRRLVHLPMGRFAEASEIAAGALFLASDDAAFVTGADFMVDGGLTAAYVTPLSP